jgi:hypothetical protein
MVSEAVALAAGTRLKPILDDLCLHIESMPLADGGESLRRALIARTRKRVERRERGLARLRERNEPPYLCGGFSLSRLPVYAQSPG